MRIKPILLLLILAALVSGCATTPNCASYQTCFSPDGGCANAITTEIGKAKTEVLIQAYYLTAPDIVQAIVNAHKRGVHVQVILDNRSNATRQDSSKEIISQAGIPTFIDSAHPISHNKVMVLDKTVVLTGSYNFTKNAERNAENLLIIRSGELAREYILNWEQHKSHSEAYVNQ